MSPLITWLWNYLLIAPHVLMVGLLVLLVRRRLYANFPLFSAYVVWEVINSVILFSLLLLPSASGTAYGWAYAIGLAISTALRFGIIYEIFAYLFRNYDRLKYFGRPLFRWGTVVLLLAGVGLAAYTGGDTLDHLLYVVRISDRTASILQCGLLVCLFLFSTYFGLSWKNHAFGIALGLGVFASMELAASAIRTNTGFAYRNVINLITMGTYHVCVLVWLIYLWAPERKPVDAAKSVPENDLELWNKELERLIRQ